MIKTFAILEKLDHKLKVVSEEILKNDKEKLIRLSYAALNHRDYWITKGLYPGIELPVVLGSDGSAIQNGKTVLFNPNINWGNKKDIPSSSYQILGLEKPGTFSTHLEIEKGKIFDAPTHLDPKEAAALPLAGLTAYRALMTKCKPKRNEKILITGIGGGVSLMVMQFSLAIGLEVFVTSSSNEKIKKAIQMGATSGVNYMTEDWHRKLKKNFGHMDIIIDSAGGDSFNKLISMVRAGGRICIYGGTTGKINNINPAHIFFKQLTIHGSTMGNDEEFIDMLDLVRQHKIKPLIDKVFKLRDINEAISYLKNSKNMGKVIVNLH